MSDFNNFNDNVQIYDNQVSTLIDEVSTTEFYIGNSNGAKNTSAAIWKIKKIWQDGSVWNIGYPNGDQGFKFIWDDRDGAYTYL